VAKYQIRCYHMIMVSVKYNLEVIDNKTFERCTSKGLNGQGEDQVGAPTKSGQAGGAGREPRQGRAGVGECAELGSGKQKKRLSKGSLPTRSEHTGSSATKGRKLEAGG